MILGIEQLPVLDTIKGMVWSCKGCGFERKIAARRILENEESEHATIYLHTLIHD